MLDRLVRLPKILHGAHSPRHFAFPRFAETRDRELKRTWTASMRIRRQRTQAMVGAPGSRQRRPEPHANFVAFPVERVVVSEVPTSPDGADPIKGALSRSCRTDRSEDSRPDLEPSPVPEPAATTGRVSSIVREVSQESAEVSGPESLAEFIERHRRMWAKRGLPPKVIDGSTLDAIAVIVRSSRRGRNENVPSTPALCKKGQAA
jgi:hypothetical protein